MLILTNYFVPSFLISIIIVFYILILYYNFNAFNTATQNTIIDVISTGLNCNYDDIDLIPDKQICKLKPFNKDFYVSTDNFTYIVSPTSTNYINVCQSLCSKGSDKNNPCEGTKEEINRYNLCVKELKSAAGCKDLSKPLGYRKDLNSGEKVNYYAKQIITISQCLN